MVYIVLLKKKKKSLAYSQMCKIERFNLLFIISRVELNWRTSEEEIWGSIGFLPILIGEAFELVLLWTKLF